MKNNKIQFASTHTTVPIALFRTVTGSTGYAIIDTGSESTLFDVEFMKNNRKAFTVRKTKSKINFIGVNDKSEHPILNVSGTVMFADDTPFKIKGMVADLTSIRNHIKQKLSLDVAAVFGSDFLKTAGAEIKFNDQTIYLNDLSGE